MDATDDARIDADLARRIADRADRDAEAELARRLLPRVRAYGLVHLRDEVAAADLAQHVAVVVIEALRAQKVDDVEHLAAFVSGACRNTVHAWKRGERRRQTILDRFGATFATSVDPTDDPSAIDKAKLVGCVERLGARDRSIVMLTFFAERPADEIARELEMTPGNLRVARHRALAQLYACVTGGAA
jgi:RNA polymerase sigma-70 factor (ECF subfamily)